MMKNIYTIAGTLLLLGAVLSCTREKALEPEQAGQMRFAVTVEGTTKASMTSADLNQFYLKVTGPDNAFSFYDTIVKEGETWKASSKRLLWKDEKSSITYAAASYGALGPDYLNVSVTDALFSSGATMGLLTDQSTQAKLNAADLLTMKETTLAFADTEDGIVPVTLKHGLAKVNFVVSIDNAGELTAEGIKDVVVSGVYNAFSFKPLTGEVTVSLGASRGAVVPFLSSIEEGVVTFESVLVPETLAAGALSLYITVNGKDFQWTNSEALTLVQGGEYTVPVSVDYDAVPVTPDPGDTVPDGAINGKFSVSDSKQVYFSKGNLRYASSKWSFFDNQYDYYTSYSADAWDHFGWSTSATTYGMNTSEDKSTYSGDFADWGATMGTGWFTLSSDEWTYLFNTRSASTVGGTENGRYAKAKVNNVPGVILFPDTYTQPDGVAAPIGVNAPGTGWNSNSYTDAEWTKMESAGCVFLPAAGYRYGSSVDYAGSYGYYWTATPNVLNFAYYMYFGSSSLNPAYSNSRYLGFSVRLVREVAAADPATARTLAEATAEDLGKIVGADGNIYDSKDAASTAGTTAVAMIAYVPSSTEQATYTPGLAIALADESRSNWSTANSTCEGKSAVTNAAWLLPSQNQWKAMFKAFGDNEEKDSGLNTAITTAGGTALLDNETYWSSTPHDEDEEFALGVFFYDASAYWGPNMMDTDNRVRACLAFTVEQGATDPAGPTAYTLAESTVGMIVGSDGKAYAVADKDNLPSGVTAVAMVAYKSGSNGLAIQLNGISVKMKWADAKTYVEELDEVSGGTWRLPSKADWQNMFVGCAVSGDATVPDANDEMDPIAGFKAKIAATGITWQSSNYWSSTESGSGAWLVGVNLGDSNARATFIGGPTNLQIYVRACLAF